MLVRIFDIGEDFRCWSGAGQCSRAFPFTLCALRLCFPACDYVFSVHGALHAVLDVLGAIHDSDGHLACAEAQVILADCEDTCWLWRSLLAVKTSSIANHTC